MLNPTNQDKTGIVLANYDGTADAENYPLGDKPQAGGAQLTITGSGFGTRTSLYDHYLNYDSSSDGTTATQLGYLGGDPDNATVTSVDSHTGTGKSLEYVYPVGNSFPKIRKETTAADSIYAAFWFKWTAPQGAGNSGIFKVFRSGSFPAYDGKPRCYETIRSTSDGIHTGKDTGLYLEDVTIVVVDHDQVTKDANEWHFVEYYYRHGDANTGNGYYASWVDGVKEFEGVDLVTRQDGASQIEYFINMIDGLDDAGYEIDVRQSEEYASDNPARVIVTDSATFSSSTKFQIQPVESWSDTEVVVTKQLGSLGAGTAYAHVFDSSNTLVASQEVTL